MKKTKTARRKAPTGSQKTKTARRLEVIMVTLSVSDIAIGFYAVFATGLVVLIGGFVDACNVVNIPPIVDAGGITVDECNAMFASMIKAGPKGKDLAAEMLVMFVNIIVRIEQNFFFCSAIAAFYALYQGPGVRKVFHLFVCLQSFCCAGSDLVFAGLPGIGSTGLVLSEEAKGVVLLPFIPVWILIGVLNGISFLKSSKEKVA